MRAPLTLLVFLFAGGCSRPASVDTPRPADASKDARPSASAAAAPAVGPSAPTAVTAMAESPYAARITWGSDGKASGFELEATVDGEVTRVARVDAAKRAFVHHLRLPRQRIVYRVRAVDAQGASAPAEAIITMPAHTAVARPLPMPPCVPMPKKAPASQGCDPEIETLEGEGRVLSSVPGAGDGCKRHLLGEYQGCTRDFGAFTIQADVKAVKGHANEGFPLLHAVTSAGAEGAHVDTLRFANGRYAMVDRAVICGEASEPEGCQLDGAR